MKSYQILKNEAEQKLNLPAGQAGNNKKENALGVDEPVEVYHVRRIKVSIAIIIVNPFIA